MSLVLAISYIVGMLMVMSTFSYFWRRRKNDPPVDEVLLKGALLYRAVMDLQQLTTLRNDKQALATLLQKGAVGDDLWTSLIEAENELGQEFRDLVAEANTFGDDWGQYIFSNANEVLQHQKLKDLKTEMKEEG
ncbi:10748_t:CDS:2 [Ambispora leptoticha]|uniref:10748_t:CDS:1 n=1 Tax=Ambispora leptoticha TaxID=144679 RepID=A0A9N8VPM7_9GLOM|nr:10748_t:CDS:2 [Ambispora leptoticha]